MLCAHLLLKDAKLFYHDAVWIGKSMPREERGTGSHFVLPATLKMEAVNSSRTVFEDVQGVISENVNCYGRTVNLLATDFFSNFSTPCI